MNNYILNGYSNEEKEKWMELHWKNVRCALAHSSTANYIWIEGEGGLHMVHRQEGGQLLAHIDVVRWQNEFRRGFDMYIEKLENRNNTGLRSKFRTYITQRK